MATLLITGGHSGIGLECVRQLAAQPGTRIILAGRSAERMAEVAAQLRLEHRVTVHTVHLDTASLQSVRDAASVIRTLLDAEKIDGLGAILCNAGGRGFGPLQYSAEGYELTFARNYLGHFLLVNLLIDQVAAHGRVIFTASGTHDPDTRDGKAVGAAAEPDAIRLANAGKPTYPTYPSGVLYSTSKLCIILFAYELHRRLRKAGSNITSIAFDPGAVIGTSFLRDAPAPVRFIAESAFGKWLMPRLGFTTGTVEWSGASLARLAIDPAYANSSGEYFQVNGEHFGQARSSKVSYDEMRAHRLWADSDQLVGPLGSSGLLSD